MSWEAIGGSIAACAGIITTVYGVIRQSKQDKSAQDVQLITAMNEVIASLQNENKRLRDRLTEAEIKIDALYKVIHKEES